MAAMARYEQSYDGERRTSAVHVQLTPGERAELEAAAEQAGTASLSAFVRILCLSRLAKPGTVAGTSRNPEARKLIYELSAIGNNLNQLTRLANTYRVMPALDELREVTALIKAAIAQVIAL
jgi:hypothetical protein